MQLFYLDVLFINTLAEFFVFLWLKPNFSVELGPAGEGKAMAKLRYLSDGREVMAWYYNQSCIDSLNSYLILKDPCVGGGDGSDYRAAGDNLTY